MLHYLSPQVLGIEHECKSLEMKILKSDEEAAQLDEDSRELEAIVQQAAEDTLAAAEAHVTSVSDGSNAGGSYQRYQAPRRPSKGYMFCPKKIWWCGLVAGMKRAGYIFCDSSDCRTLRYDFAWCCYQISLPSYQCLLLYTVPWRNRAEGSATLTVVLRNMPVHEEKRKQTTSFLQDHESKTRSRIAEVGRLAAELRY